LSTNPVDKKIVFLENMERMTNSAFNALLKIFEELPKNVYVLSTTSNI
jgi:DNA polymerase III gamma/tau subunit